jgi:arylsulfatase A-like enzyme
LFTTVALVVGYPIVAVLSVLLVVFVLRLIQVQFLSPAVSEAHLEQKQHYLDSVKAAPTEAPNIVIIFFDDLGWGDLSSYGSQLIDTPHIDSVAQQGLKMTDFYSASPVCTPSRAALLTGRYPPRTRTDRHVFFPDSSLIGTGRRMIGLANALPKEEITIAEVLAQAGYRTHMIGKWHLGDAAGYRPTDFGFQNWYGLLFSNDMYPLDLYRNNEIVIEDQRAGSFFSNERDEMSPLQGLGVDQQGLTTLYTDEAVSFLESVGDTPFFLYLSHTFPHVPHYPSTAYAGNSKGGRYGDVVEDLDRSTGTIMQALARLDLAANTIVMITSDNGADYNGSPGMLRGRKGEILEGGQRVPMIVRWPGRVEASSSSRAMAMNTDIFPTLMGLTGQPLPDDRVIDGRDLSKLWLHGGDSPHDYLYYFPVLDSLPGAIRDGDLKLLLSSKDLGRDRPHLSRLQHDTENHEVGNLYPKRGEMLKQALLNKRQQVADNPRGWIDN